MFTVCPKCALTLVVTAADLRVAQGYVRCGRCSSVFNALAQLSDERGAARAPAAPPPEPGPEEPAPAPPAPSGRAGAPASHGGADAEAAIPEGALEFDPESTDAASVFVAAPPSPQWTAATGSFKALVAANQEAVTPAPTGDDVEVELDAALLSEIVRSKPAPAPPASQRPDARDQRPVGDATAAAARTGRAPERDAPAGTGQADAGELAPLEAAALPQATRRPRLWAAGAGLLAVILLAQIVDHQRDALATDPRLNPALTALYAALGVQLTPRWDLRSYDVRQLGATVDQGSRGAITVRASIRNAGPRPQPLPLLRVTLQDRFGNRLASRDVSPRDYVPRGIPPSALLGRDQRIDAELAFVDPGASAVGFELDACLPRSGAVACANDASAR